MGLSSSQARLLSLTSRQHDIEYKAQRLEAQKLQMANESNSVYQEYENALNAQKIQLKTIGTDGSASYIDATYNNLVAAGYKISSGSATMVSQSDIDYFNSTADGNAVEFACLKSGFCQKSGSTITLTSDPTKNCIFTASQLQTEAASSSGKTFVLMDDLNVTSSMGSFAGTLDGNGNTINISGDNAIFSSLNNATISNLNIVSNINNTVTSIGIAALAVEASGTTNLSNISASGSIDYSTRTRVGSLVGTVYTGSTLNISNCESSIDISGNTETGPDIGGLVGGCYGGTVNIDSSSYTGDMNIQSTAASGTDTTTGGILGTVNSSGTVNITNCYVESNYITNDGSGDIKMGGILGSENPWSASYNVNISNSAAYISTLGSDSSTSSIGGIVGTMTIAGTIADCYSDIDNLSGSTTASTVGNLGAAITVDSCYSASGTTQNTATTNTESEVLASIPTAGTTRATTNTNNDPSSVAGYNSYLEIGNAIKNNTYFLIGDHGNDPTWLTNMIDMGMIILSKKDSTTGEYSDTNVATDTNLQEVSDTTQLKKAEAKYEAAMAKIDAKDKKYDTDIAALDTERKAIKTEMDTLKSVAKDNVDRTFRLFSS